MMGRQEVAQAPLFYSFNLESHIPANHLLRGIDRLLDLGELHEHLAPHYSSTGRPSIDPALLIRMLVVGYCLGIRSERRLCEEGQTQPSSATPEPGVPLVLPARSGRQGAGSLNVLEEPARPVS
jgi:hypothetical protein